MAAAKLDLYIEQGAKFYRTVTFKVNNVAVNITGWTFRGQIRTSQTSADIVASFSFAIRDQVLYTGQVEITLSDVVTSAIPVPSTSRYTRKTSKYIYDIEVINTSGVVDRMLEGTVEVSPEVTR